MSLWEIDGFPHIFVQNQRPLVVPQSGRNSPRIRTSTRHAVVYRRFRKCVWAPAHDESTPVRLHRNIIVDDHFVSHSICGFFASPRICQPSIPARRFAAATLFISYVGTGCCYNSTEMGYIHFWGLYTYLLGIEPLQFSVHYCCNKPAMPIKCDMAHYSNDSAHYCNRFGRRLSHLRSNRSQKR